MTANKAPLARIRDLSVHFSGSGKLFSLRKSAVIRAVDGVSFDIPRGGTLGLVGESGCGKTTLGRAIAGLTPPTTGEISFDLASTARDRKVQMIFQDPYASLNPRMTIGATIAEPVKLNGLRDGAAAVAARMAELLDMVGLDPAMAGRYPYEFSGGQRQRVGIARALACEPELIVCDEAVSALDVSIQAQVIVLLEELRDRLGLTYLFVAHGLSALRHISDTVAVMYLGKIVEIGPKAEVFTNPRHAYTRALLSAVPVPNPLVERQRQRIILQGELPSPANPPGGCRFHTRCPVATDQCRTDIPELRDIAAGHQTACWRAEDLPALMPDNHTAL
jgi:oligopeptide/dipeptide ABC transporter ATP-binding protein